MSRRCSYRVPADTSLFTPLHLQPAAVCRLAFSAAGVWLRRNAVSHRQLVGEHRTGLVLWSVRLVFGSRLSFFDAEELEIEVTARLRARGAQFECEVSVGDPPAARLHACLIPLRLDDGDALLGAPAAMSPDVVARFLPHEVEERPHLSPVPRLRAEITAECRPLAAMRTPFRVHRHQCEVADQWFWAEAVSLGERGREQLIEAEAERVPCLRQAMRVPLEQLDVLFQRPYYLLERGAIISTAYEWRGRLAFVHEFVGEGVEDARPRALAIEQFPGEAA